MGQHSSRSRRGSKERRIRIFEAYQEGRTPEGGFDEGVVHRKRRSEEQRKARKQEKYRQHYSPEGE